MHRTGNRGRGRRHRRSLDRRRAVRTGRALDQGRLRSDEGRTLGRHRRRPRVDGRVGQQQQAADRFLDLSRGPPTAHFRPPLGGPASCRPGRLLRKQRPLTEACQSGWLQAPPPFTIGSSHAIDAVLAGLPCRLHDLARRLRRSQTSRRRRSRRHHPGRWRNGPFARCGGAGHRGLRRDRPRRQHGRIVRLPVHLWRRRSFSRRGL